MLRGSSLGCLTARTASGPELETRLARPVSGVAGRPEHSVTVLDRLTPPPRALPSAKDVPTPDGRLTWVLPCRSRVLDSTLKRLAVLLAHRPRRGGALHGHHISRAPRPGGRRRRRPPGRARYPIQASARARRLEATTGGARRSAGSKGCSSAPCACRGCGGEPLRVRWRWLRARNLCASRSRLTRLRALLLAPRPSRR